MTSKSTQFELLGYNHVALVCADMQKTVDFYEGILGFPLVKTLEYAGGTGQHFFFQVTEDDGVAFFWFADAPAAAPGVASAPWQFTDEQGRPTGGIAGVAAKDAMHHLAFDVPLEKIDEYREPAGGGGGGARRRAAHDRRRGAAGGGLPALAVLPRSRRDHAGVLGNDAALHGGGCAARAGDGGGRSHALAAGEGRRHRLGGLGIGKTIPATRHKG
jgi:catechol 2,3-dioxygenase-like lactoylglutathione lyase family enzyme